MSQPPWRPPWSYPFEQLRMTDVEVVGGKNASPRRDDQPAGRQPACACPAASPPRRMPSAQFLRTAGWPSASPTSSPTLNTDDVRALAEAGAQIRQWVVDTPFPADWKRPSAPVRAADRDNPGASFAVRSSATAEDLPDASFAGQQETFLNVSGIDDVLHRMKEVFASLYNDRAISYRVHKGFAHADVALSAGVQRMVRSDLGAAGVMFTIDTESGFKDVVFITSSYGLGETVVQGAVNPDEFYVHKPTLAAGRFPVIRRVLGSKLQRMEFASAERRPPAASWCNVDTPPEQRNRYSLTDADVTNWRATR
jgi:pyruvate,water dikinase